MSICFTVSSVKINLIKHVVLSSIRVFSVMSDLQPTAENRSSSSKSRTRLQTFDIHILSSTNVHPPRSSSALLSLLEIKPRQKSDETHTHPHPRPYRNPPTPSVLCFQTTNKKCWLSLFLSRSLSLTSPQTCLHRQGSLALSPLPPFLAAPPPPRPAASLPRQPPPTGGSRARSEPLPALPREHGASAAAGATAFEDDCSHNDNKTHTRRDGGS